MATPGWYNENLGRSYPFLRDELTGTDLDDTVIVDFGCTFGVHAGFIEGEHYVRLVEASKSGSTITFEFRTDAPGLYGKSLFFTRNIDDVRYTVQYSQAEDNDIVVASEDSINPCEGSTEWSGFLVTGDLDSLSSLTTIALTADVEPGTIDNSYKSYVSSISLANADRTRATTQDLCDDYDWPFETGKIYVKHRCMTGKILMSEGYNCQIDIEGSNTIVIGAGVGRGAGEVCEEVKLFEDETSHVGGSLLTGGPTCDEVLRTINGVGGRNLNLLAGRGVTLTTVPNQSKIIIDVSMAGLSVCNSADSVDPDDCPSEESDSDCSTDSI